MMEIPAGASCSSTWASCCYLQLDMDNDVWMCRYPLKKYAGLLTNWGGLGYFEESKSPLRCPACLSAYPNGATVTITAKEVK